MSANVSSQVTEYDPLNMRRNIGRLQIVERRLEDIDVASLTAISVLKTDYSESPIVISLTFSYKESV